MSFNKSRTYRKIENIDKVPEPHRENIRYLIVCADDLFARNGMKGNMIHGFLYDCVEGQIIISTMPRKRKEQFYNYIGHFYIDDRVGFTGIREMREIISNLENEFMQFTKFKKQKCNIGDWVVIRKDTSNKCLISDLNNFDLSGKKAKVVKFGGRDLSNPEYEAFYIRIEGKGPYIYASADDVNLSRMNK